MQDHRTKSLDPLKLGQCPDVIRQSRVWLGYRLETRVDAQGEASVAKVPIDVETGGYARTNDPSTWSTQERAVAAYWNGTLEGVGYARIGDQVFIDGDGCVVNGRILPWAEEVIHALNTYAEFSPNDGIHIIARGKLPLGRRQYNFGDRPRHGIAFYDGNRYFTATGRCITHTREVLETPALLKVWEKYCGSKTAGETRREPRVSVPDDDADERLIQRACRSGDRRFRRLWTGNREGYASPSEADWALLERLAFWTGGDAERMERLFEQSRLARDKWEKRPDYRDRTIERVLERLTDTWKGKE
jgi:primase-polymerase (primpol)-like protein